MLAGKLTSAIALQRVTESIPDGKIKSYLLEAIRDWQINDDNAPQIEDFDGVVA